MPPPSRAYLIRAAGRIAAELQPPRIEIDVLPLSVWDRAQRCYALMATAQQRGWRSAASVSRERLRRSLGDLRRQLDEFDRQLVESSHGYSPSLRDLYDDLTALATEFPDCSLDLAEATISVVTQPIVLEGVDLGRFEIELSWRGLGSRSTAYLVRSLDERHASSDSSLVHPHVRDEQLCEGEADAPIRLALRHGRILDFFTIVAQTLATYNAESADLALDRWEGVSCADCGATTDDDCRSSCERCGADLCDDCCYGCTACGRTACSDCGAPCADCGEHHCQSCLAPCLDCGQLFCERALDEQQCDQCRTTAAVAEDAADEAAADSPPSSAADDSNQPLRLGETPLPA